MSIRKIVLLLLLASLFSACGEGTVSIDNTFEPRIVVQGYLMPHNKAEVRLMRNFPVDARVTEESIIITDAEAVLIDESGSSFDLRYNFQTRRYESTEIVIDYGKQYTLEVRATVDGKSLFTRSVTTVPEAGFEILEEKSVLDSMFYRQRDASGALMDFKIVFNRSPATDFYACALNALDADTSSFIFDNPFNDPDIEDIIEDFEDYKNTFTWIQDQPNVPGESSIDIFSFFTWFYGEYRAIAFAGDRNFRDFLISHGDVQEIDGNFHEPAFHFEGDGIGVFGSAIADTTFFTILRRPAPDDGG